MPKKIRVYELARELGLTNKEGLELALSLGIGVKSHSSSIEDAQADRVRRKADAEGLRRPVVPIESNEASSAKELDDASSQQGTGRSSGKTTAKSRDKIAQESTLDADVTSGEASGEAAATKIPSAAKKASSALKKTSTTAKAPAAKKVTAATKAPSAAKKASSIAKKASFATSATQTSDTPQDQVDSLSQVVSDSIETSEPPAPPAPPAQSGPPAPSGLPAPSGPQETVVSSKQRQASAHRVSGTLDETKSKVQTSQGSITPKAVSSRDKDLPPAQDKTPTPSGSSPTSSTEGSPVESAALSKSSKSANETPSPIAADSKPIPPPPPKPPVGLSGRPIPPPPGMGGRRVPPSQGRSSGPGYSSRGSRPPASGGASRGGPSSGRSGPGTSSTTSSGGSGSRGSGSSGGFPARSGGYSARPGGSSPRTGGSLPRSGGPPSSGGPPPPSPGRGGGQPGRRPPQRRAKRRRRNLEELEPTQLTTYTPSTAPIPEGEIIVERGSTARDLGPKFNRGAGDVIRFLLLQGEMVTTTQSLTDDMIELFAAELDAKVHLVDPGEEQEAELLAKYFDEDEEEDHSDLRPRPPVVTVMGHVDHGKTLLLDRIRSANVVAGEAGGITQHIGAYQASCNGHLITFIDTPGHEAFTAMRARGAEVTDIVVLVVAGDDGVMPQTIEAIDHARAAQVPIVVAVNKMDRPDADPNRVLQQLSERGLVPEEWGGDTITVQVSALKGDGVEELLEQLTLVAELEELTASPEGRVRGTVLEANFEVGRGPVATVVVQQGTLRVGDPIVAGAAWGKVKALLDDHGAQVKEALPSMPVQILGLSEPPQPGDELREAVDLGRARTLGEARAQRFRLSGHLPAVSATSSARLEDLFEQIQKGETATLNLVLKADMQGSLEAVTESLRKLEREDVKLSFVLRGIGGITENDVQLARASKATIIGFNVRPDRRSRELAEDSDVEIRSYEIIYKLLEDIEAAMLGMLAPEFEEVVTGEAEVRQVFRIPRIGAIAGCQVREGKITRGSKVRFLREGVIIWKGTITSLRRFKEDVREVLSGFECGIGLSDYQDLKEGDIIETFEEKEISRT